MRGYAIILYEGTANCHHEIQQKSHVSSFPFFMLLNSDPEFPRIILNKMQIHCLLWNNNIFKYWASSMLRFDQQTDTNYQKIMKLPGEKLASWPVNQLNCIIQFDHLSEVRNQNWARRMVSTVLNICYFHYKSTLPDWSIYPVFQ